MFLKLCPRSKLKKSQKIQFLKQLILTMEIVLLNLILIKIQIVIISIKIMI